MELRELLFDLCSRKGVSGHELGLSEHVCSLLKDDFDKVWVDAMGSVHAVINGCGENRKTVLFDAHIDQIGLMVTGMEKDGFLRFTQVGGFDFRTLPDANVTVHGKKDIFGVITAKPPHIQSAKDYEKTIDMKDMFIDTALDDGTLSETVEVGDIVTINGDPMCLMSDVICSSGLDDRAGAAILIDTAKRLKKEKLPVDIEVLLSTGEEFDASGATAAAYTSDAVQCICVDVSHAKTPDSPEGQAYEFGGGAMIGVGPNMKRYISKKMMEIAEKKGIPYQIEVMGGHTGTNAWWIETANRGIPCGLVSIPLKYMHTMIETIRFSDLEAVGNLIYEYMIECWGGEKA